MFSLNQIMSMNTEQMTTWQKLEKKRVMDRALRIQQSNEKFQALLGLGFAAIGFTLLYIFANYLI
jgi:hypothetical protein